MATIWTKLGKLGPGWVIPLGGLAFSVVVLVFGYLFETTYYAAFGVEIENHVSRTYFASSPLRYPVTFGWTALFALIFAVDLSVMSEIKSIRQGSYQLLVQAAILYGAYLLVTDDAGNHAKTLTPIELGGADDEGVRQAYLLIGDIGSKLVVCNPTDGSVEIIEQPKSIRFPKSAGAKVASKPCRHAGRK